LVEFRRESDLAKDIKRTVGIHEYQEEEDIISFVKKKKVSYTKEIANNLAITPEYTKTKLIHLVKFGRLKKLRMPPYNVPTVLKRRLNELWALGIQGYSTFARMYFVVPIEYEEEKHEKEPFKIICACEGKQSCEQCEEIPA